MKTKKMLLFTAILLLLVSPTTTVQAKKVNKQTVNVEQAYKLSWPELKRSTLVMPDILEGFRCCVLSNGMVKQLKKLEKNPKLRAQETVYPGASLKIETPVCETIENAFEEYTGIKIVFLAKYEDDGRVRLRVIRLEAIAEGEERWI